MNQNNSIQNSAAYTSINVDDLAQEIRRVDGKHEMGAGALAEALMPFIDRHVQVDVRARVPNESIVKEIIRERDGWQEDAKWLRANLVNAQRSLDVMRAAQSNDVWFWAGDDGDHLESMAHEMKVVIRADELRALLTEQQKADKRD